MVRREADDNGIPREMQAHAALLRQKNALQREVERAARQEQELQRALTFITPSEDAPVGESEGNGGDQSCAGEREEEKTRQHARRKRSSTREGEEDGDQADGEGGGEGQPKLKKSKVAAGLGEARGESSPPVKASVATKTAGGNPDPEVSAR